MHKRYKIPIVKKGEFPNGNLIQVIDDASLDAIVANTMASLGKTGKVLADFDHYSELSKEVKQALEALGVQLPTAAGGWIGNLYREGDTVYGDMVSTPEGEQAIESKTYCKTSPTFRLIDCKYLGNRGNKRTVRPLKVKSVALCNKPNMESLGSIMANREAILNIEDDLQSVFLGSAMDLEKEKNMENDKEVIENASPAPAQEAVVANAEPAKAEEEKVVETVEGTDVTVEDVKEATVQDLSAQVGITAESQGLTAEEAQVVADVATTVGTLAVETVETAVEDAQTADAPESNQELEDAKTRIAELETKINELQAVIDEAGKARQEAELQNRIAEELAKYPTLQNREEASELLKKDWDLGTRFLSSLKFSVVSSESKTIQNRVPAKSPEASYAGMSAKERIRIKMFGK